MLLRLARQALIPLFVVVGLMQTACAENQALTAAHHTLDLTAIAVNTSWAFAVDMRELEQREVLSRARASEIEVAEAERLIAAIRDAWEPRLAAFRAVREAHEAAVTIYEGVKAGQTPLGALSGALANIYALYLELKRILPEHIVDRMP